MRTVSPRSSAPSTRLMAPAPDPRSTRRPSPSQDRTVSVDLHRDARREPVAQEIIGPDDLHRDERREPGALRRVEVLLILVQDLKPGGAFDRRYDEAETAGTTVARSPTRRQRARAASQARRRPGGLVPVPSLLLLLHFLMVESCEATPYRSIVVLSNCVLK